MPIVSKGTAILFAAVTLAGCDAVQDRADHIENTAQSIEASATAIEKTAERFGERIEGTTDNAIAALTPALTAQEFINEAARSNAFEIAAARLAATNTQSAEVQAFANQMLAAHTEAAIRIKSAAAAARPAITPDGTLTDEQQDILADLEALSGPAFDADYLAIQVDAHQAARDLMRAYAAKGKDVAAKSAAADLEKMTIRHLAAAYALAEKTDLAADER